MSAEQENQNKVQCKVCGKYFKAITNSHLKTHNMTTEDYKETYQEEASFGNFDRFKEWRNSEENKKQLKKMSEKVYSSTEIKARRKKAMLAAVKSEKYRKEQSERMKEYVQNNPEKYGWASDPDRITDWMRLSNYERWIIQYGREEADIRLENWKSNNKIPSSSKNTAPEIQFAAMLSEMEISYEQQYSVDRYYCDFYLPDYNLVIEVDGDYWHANPNQFTSDDLIGPKQIRADKIWESDQIREEQIKSCGYNMLRIWASDLNTINLEDLLEDIVHASGKLLG